jgi:S1-C subfamily serine protease
MCILLGRVVLTISEEAAEQQQAGNGPAGAAGLRPGAVITRVDGTLVHDLQHFEGLVLQAGRTLRVTLEPGGEVVLPRPRPPTN